MEIPEFELSRSYPFLHGISPSGIDHVILTESFVLKTTFLLCSRRGIVFTTYILILYFNPSVLIFFLVYGRM